MISIADAVRFIALIVFTLPLRVDSGGRGPTSIWLASERFILVADSSVPGLVLVDKETGRATNRLVLDADPISVSSCSNCDFIVVTARGGKFFRLRLSNTVADLLEEDSMKLEDAIVELLPVTFSGEDSPPEANTIVVSDDGSEAYFTSEKEKAIYKLDLSSDVAELVVKLSKRKPYGIHLNKDGHLLVTMQKKVIVKYTKKGGIIEAFNLEKADCPNIDLRPKLRHAVDDPLNDDCILVLGTQPSFDSAAIWRLNYRINECEILAGQPDQFSGWLDTTSDYDALFSQSNHLAVGGGASGPSLVVADLDNRALRIVDLVTERTSSLMYDRDRRAEEIPESTFESVRSCLNSFWDKPVQVQSIYGTLAFARDPFPKARWLPFDKAERHCKIQGARLCDPAELRESNVTAHTRAWTSAKCASCFKSSVKDKCSADIVPNGPIGKKTLDFVHSWNDGRAVEIGSSAYLGPATICVAKDQPFLAAAPCCVDCIFPSEDSSN